MPLPTPRLPPVTMATVPVSVPAIMHPPDEQLTRSTNLPHYFPRLMDYRQHSTNSHQQARGRRGCESGTRPRVYCLSKWYRSSWRLDRCFRVLYRGEDTRTGRKGRTHGDRDRAGAETAVAVCGASRGDSRDGTARLRECVDARGLRAGRVPY